WVEKIQTHRADFETAMDDDFNTANAITVLFDIAKDANLYLEENQTEVNVLDAFLDIIRTFLEVLGITLENEGLLDDEIEALIVERNEARQEKNYQRADEIRDMLKEKHIILEDTAQGVRWRREKS